MKNNLIFKIVLFQAILLGFTAIAGIEFGKSYYLNTVIKCKSSEKLIEIGECYTEEGGFYNKNCYITY